jgi:serine/threonine protein kinase
MFNDPPASTSGVGWPAVRASGVKIGGARYVLKRKLGQGRYTEVWLARDVKWERDITLKFLPHQFLEDGAILDQLDTEVRRSAQLAHPAIARVFQFICEHEVAAIATEYVDGWSLATRKLDQPHKRFPKDDINLWVHQICAALDYAHHEFCLVHRDLNPSNLLLNRREQLKVTDFGIDHAVRAAARVMDANSGRIGYLSPQQLRGSEPSVLDDIYALGATLYDLITGSVPFTEGDVERQILETVAPGMNDLLRERGVDEPVPIAWEETVAACLAKDPGMRPQSASEVLRCFSKKTFVQPAQNYGSSQPMRDLSRKWNELAQNLLGRCRNLLVPIADKLIDAFRANPRLLLMAILSVAALNLGLALWFLFRR